MIRLLIKYLLFCFCGLAVPWVSAAGKVTPSLKCSLEADFSSRFAVNNGNGKGKEPAGAADTGNQLGVDKILSLTKASTPKAVQHFREFLSIPNDAHYPNDIAKVVTWLEDAFSRRHFDVTILKTPGNPLLVAERRYPGASRTVLVYLQADGQPVDPPHWDQENPYVAVLKKCTEDGWRPVPWPSDLGDLDPSWRIFARSTSDSKGPIIQFLTAISALDAAGISPEFDLKVIVDTAEEMDNPHLPPAVKRNRKMLAADMLIIFDGPPHSSNRPTVKFGARGIARVTLTTYGPRVAQHSGHYGNYTPNPAFTLSSLLASMKSGDGRVTIPGFYEGISIDKKTREILSQVPYDEKKLWSSLGIAGPDKVADTLQLSLQYPSLNILGISAGWTGDQTRNIIPATATAEMDIRLVKENNPQHLVKLIQNHIRDNGFYLIDREPTEKERLSYSKIVRFNHQFYYRAFRTDFESEPGRLATGAVRHLYGHDPIRLRTSGGSIPISPFVDTLGIPAVSIPTVNIDNNQHSPNENIRVGNFINGISTIISFLSQKID